MDTSKFTDGAELFRVVDWVDGVSEMQKYGLESITARWYLRSLDPEKSPKIDNFAATTTDHN